MRNLVIKYQTTKKKQASMRKIPIYKSCAGLDTSLTVYATTAGHEVVAWYTLPKSSVIGKVVLPLT